MECFLEISAGFSSAAKSMAETAERRQRRNFHLIIHPKFMVGAISTLALIFSSI